MIEAVLHPTNFYTPAPLNKARPILGVVWHDTESGVPVECSASGSWHYQILRDGTIWRHVPEDACAWHVRACDRYQPPWVIASPVNTSDPNYCTIGVEMVSYAGYRIEDEAFTDAQYDAVRQLAADLEGRYGPLWHIGHGDVQADRSDPVSFDWNRAGFGEWTSDGRRFGGADMTDDQKKILADLTSWGINTAQDLEDWHNWSSQTWEDYQHLREQDALDKVTMPDNLVGILEARIAAAQAALAGG